MNLKEKLAEAQKKLEDIMAKEDKTADELKAAMEEVKSAKANLEAAEEAEKLLGSMKGTEGPADKEEEVVYNTIGEKFAAEVKAKQIDKKGRFAVKTYSDIQKTPTTSGVAAFATTYDRNVVEAARTPLVIRDLFGAEQISGSTLVYLTEGAIEGSPAATNEANKKPQVHFGDPTPHTVSLSKIAAFIKESDEYINDYAFLASAINGRLLYHHQLVVQNTLVTALKGTSGIGDNDDTWTASSTATELADLILKEAMDLQNASGFPADAIVMNPATWYALRVAKDGEYRYYGGGFFGAQNVPNLWGIPVCVTTAVDADEIIVGAFKACASVVTNGGISIEAVNTDQDDFVKNLMTIRCEERLALAVRRPAGFTLIEKAAGGAS